MMHVYEFELLEKEGAFLVFPCDLEGATSGATLREACEMAADWLKLTIEHCAIHDVPLPEPTFGNEPANGGRIVAIAVDAGLHTVPRMSAAEAARALGVSPSRVSHMIRDGKLESFKHGHNTWVSRYHVEAILSSPRRAGRPKGAKDHAEENVGEGVVRGREEAKARRTRSADEAFDEAARSHSRA